MSNAPSPSRIAVVGATSLIGEAVIEELRARKFAVAKLHALDDARDIGPTAGDDDDTLPVGDVAAFDFSSVDVAFFCARSAVAQRYAEAAAAHAWVIDASGAFRLRRDVPLVAADVNAAVLVPKAGHGLVSLPGSAGVALATVLAPLHALAGLARIDVATYQAVSGSGRSAMEALASETVALLGGRKPAGRAFGMQIAFNVIPQVDAMDEAGVSREERRLMDEIPRLLGVPGLAVNATAVRVPVFFGHSFAVHASFERPVSVADATAMLQRGSGVTVYQASSAAPYPTPATLAVSPDRVYVGRLRLDPSRDRSLNFWVVADNIRKCAAHNAVSVAQILVNGT